MVKNYWYIPAQCLRKLTELLTSWPIYVMVQFKMDNNQIWVTYLITFSKENPHVCNRITFEVHDTTSARILVCMCRFTFKKKCRLGKLEQFVFLWVLSFIYFLFNVLFKFYTRVEKRVTNLNKTDFTITNSKLIII